MQKRIEGWIDHWVARPIACVIVAIWAALLFCRLTIVLFAGSMRDRWTAKRSACELKGTGVQDVVVPDLPQATIAPAPIEPQINAPVRRRNRRDLAAKD